MFGRRGRSYKTNTDKQSKKKERRKRSEKRPKATQKGRGRRARETIREPPQPPKKVKQQPMSRNAGPPLRIGDGSVRKQVTGTTPEEVVRNIRRQRR